jgi:5'-methylthioadenosine phosphorylase
MEKQSRLGIIGGSGIYDLPELKNSDWIHMESNFGKPSDKLLLGTLNNMPIAFLPRHGRNHQYSPGNINYKANIEALKVTGVNKIISISAVGSLKENLIPGNLVLPDQFIDNTKKRDSTFFEDDIVGHVSLAKPICSELKNRIFKSSENINVNVINNSTYIVIEGPHFSTKSESLMFKDWGADIVGMTCMPESKLAREAEICYSNLSLITDFDCWKDEEQPVNAKIVIKNFNNNISKIHSIITNLSNDENLLDDCEIGCQNSLDNAITTKLNSTNLITQKKLRNIIKRIL